MDFNIIGFVSASGIAQVLLWGCRKYFWEKNVSFLLCLSVESYRKKIVAYHITFNILISAFSYDYLFRPKQKLLQIQLDLIEGILMHWEFNKNYKGLPIK